MPYNLIMFLSAIQGYIVATVISVVVLQYAFALFCLLKLAYMDISKRDYILWNVLILLVFFIGGAVFLVYYFKHPEKHVAKEPAIPTGPQDADENKDDGMTDENTDSDRAAECDAGSDKNE